MDLLAFTIELHGLLQVVAGAITVGIIVATIVALLGSERARFAVDWLILALAGTVAVSALAGGVLLFGTGGPRDVLHLLYGVIVLAALPVARFVGSRPPADAPSPMPGVGAVPRRGMTNRLATWLLGAALATLAAMLRLAATG